MLRAERAYLPRVTKGGEVGRAMPHVTCREGVADTWHQRGGQCHVSPRAVWRGEHATCHHGRYGGETMARVTTGGFGGESMPRVTTGGMAGRAWHVSPRAVYGGESMPRVTTGTGGMAGRAYVDR